MRRGSAAVISLVVMLFVLTAGGALLAWITNETRITPNVRDVLEAEYAAEGGAKRAVSSFLNNKTDWTWLGTPVAFTNENGKTYTVTVEKTSSTSSATVYTITSVGKVNQATKTVVVMVKVTYSGGAGSGTWSDYTSEKSPFHYAGYSGGSTTFAAPPAINGSPYAYSGAIAGQRDNQTKYIPSSDALFPTYAEITATTPSDRPVYDNSSFVYDSTTNTYTITQNQNIKNASIVINGDLTVKPNVNFENVTIYVTGNVTMVNSNFNGANLIVAGGSLQCTGNNSNFGSSSVVVVFGSTFLTNTNINGTIVTRGSVAFNGNTNLNYNMTAVSTLVSSSSSGSVSVKEGSWETTN